MVDDYIRREDAIMEVCNLYETLKFVQSADVVEVVRCKDCKYVGTDATCCLVCCRDGMGLKPYHVYHDDYCSYGKRRGGEQNG